MPYTGSTLEHHERNKKETGSCLSENNKEDSEPASLKNGNNVEYSPKQGIVDEEFYFKQHPDHTHNEVTVSSNRNAEVLQPSIADLEPTKANHQQQQYKNVDNDVKNENDFNKNVEDISPPSNRKSEVADETSNTETYPIVKEAKNDFISNNKNEKFSNDNENKAEVNENCLSLDYSATRRKNNEVEPKLQTVNNDNEEPSENKAESDKRSANRYFNAPPRHNSKPGFYVNQLADPAKGSGVSPFSASGVNLWDHNRVCYACSSASNPACLQPDRRTTVKYCLKGHESCVTKTYQTGKNRGK